MCFILSMPKKLLLTLSSTASGLPPSWGNVTVISIYVPVLPVSTDVTFLISHSFQLEVVLVHMIGNIAVTIRSISNAASF